MRKRKAFLALFVVLVMVAAITTSALAKDPRADADDIAGLNTTRHTPQEIREYIREHGNITGVADCSIAYSEDPSWTEPFATGALSTDTKLAVIDIVNSVRYIAGLLPVSWANDGQADRMNGCVLAAANHMLTTSPEQPKGMSDSMFRSGRSALQEGIMCAGDANPFGDIIDKWMGNWDMPNDYVPRRWILSPRIYAVNYGAVTGVDDRNGSYSSFHTLANSQANTPTNMAWPAQQMPVEYFPDRAAWSYQWSGTAYDSDQPQVELTRLSDGRTWNFSRSSSEDGPLYYGTFNNYWRGNLVFQPSGLECHAGDRFRVSITGINEPVTYDVEFFSLDGSSEGSTSMPTSTPTSTPTPPTPTPTPTLTPGCITTAPRPDISTTDPLRVIQISGPENGVCSGETIEISVSTSKEGALGRVETTGLEVLSVSGGFSTVSDLMLATEMDSESVYTCRVTAEAGETVSFAIQDALVTENGEDYPTMVIPWEQTAQARMTLAKLVQLTHRYLTDDGVTLTDLVRAAEALRKTQFG